MNEATEAPTEPAVEEPVQKSGSSQLRDLYRRVRGPVRSAVNNSGMDLSDPVTRHTLQSIAFDSATAAISDSADEIRGKDATIDNLQQQIEKDPETGFYNKTGFQNKIKEVAKFLERSEDQDATVMVIDGDGLKGINDAWGHLVGDKAIESLCDAIRNHVRGMDVVARWGGDEFGLILIHKKDTAGLALARTIWERINETLSAIDFGTGQSFSVSGGAARLDPNSPTGSFELADLNETQAKKDRNNPNNEHFGQQTFYTTEDLE